MAKNALRNWLAIRIARNLLIATALFHFHAASLFAQDKILIINSGKEPVYSEYAQLLNQHLTRLSNDKFKPRVMTRELIEERIPLNDYALLITAGPQAFEHILSLAPKTPLLATFMPSQEYFSGKDQRYHCATTQCFILFMDQPLARQLRLSHVMFPDKKAVGIFRNNFNQGMMAEYQYLARKFEIKLVQIPVSNTESVVEVLQENIQNIDVLLSQPDPEVFNQNTAKGILLTTYYNRVPLIAYSTSFVKSGATAGIYSSLDDLAKHAAQSARSLVTAQGGIPRIEYPKYYQVEINRKVSDSLNLDIPATDKILKALNNDDSK